MTWSRLVSIKSRYGSEPQTRLRILPPRHDPIASSHPVNDNPNFNQDPTVLSTQTCAASIIPLTFSPLVGCHTNALLLHNYYWYTIQQSGTHVNYFIIHTTSCWKVHSGTLGESPKNIYIYIYIDKYINEYFPIFMSFFGLRNLCVRVVISLVSLIFSYLSVI